MVARCSRVVSLWGVDLRYQGLSCEQQYAGMGEWYNPWVTMEALLSTTAWVSLGQWLVFSCPGCAICLHQ